MMFLFWIIIGFGIYYLYTHRDESTGSGSQQSAEDKLKERYVNGEIDTETYQHMLKTLRD